MYLLFFFEVRLSRSQFRPQSCEIAVELLGNPSYLMLLREDVLLHVRVNIYREIRNTFVPTAPSLVCAGRLSHFLMIYIHYREHSYTSVTGLFILFLLQLGFR